MDPAPHGRGGRGRRLLRRFLLVGLLAVVLLVGGAVAFVALADLDGLARGAVERALPDLSQRLGRTVEVSAVDVDLFPRPSVAVGGVRVEGRGGVPLVDVGEVRANLQVWPLVRSLGKDVRVGSVVVVRPVVRVVRDGAGRWVDADVVERAGRQPAGQAPSERELRIGHVAVRDGRLALLSLQPGAAPREQASLSDVRLDAADVGPGLPLDARMEALLAEAPLKARMKTDPTQPGAWPALDGEVEVKGLALEKLGPVLGGAGLAGRVQFAAAVTTKGGRYELDGKVTGDDLRFGGAPLDVSAPLTASIVHGELKTAQVRIADARLTGQGIDLKASLTARPLVREARFEVTGETLDVAALSALAPKKGESRDRRSSGERSTALNTWRAEGTVRFDALRTARLTATDLRAKAVLAGGTLTLREAGARVEGARLVLDGSRLVLGPPLRWELDARLEGLDLARASASFTKLDATGSLDAQADLRGAGSTPEELRRALTGTVSLALEDAAVRGPDLSAQLERSLLDSLGGSAVGTLVKDFVPQASLGRTELKDLRVQGNVRDGWVTLARPVTLETRLGALSLDGRVGLDKRLDLTGTVKLPPAFVRALTRGAFTPRAPVAVPFALGGTVKKPVVEGLDASALVSTLAGEALQEGAERGLRDALRGRIPGL